MGGVKPEDFRFQFRVGGGPWQDMPKQTVGEMLWWNDWCAAMEDAKRRNDTDEIARLEALATRSDWPSGSPATA